MENGGTEDGREDSENSLVRRGATDCVDFAAGVSEMLGHVECAGEVERAERRAHLGTPPVAELDNIGCDRTRNERNWDSRIARGLKVGS